MQLGIVTEIDRCIGCLACAVACKMENGVPIGIFYDKILRVGPSPKFVGAKFPNVEMYFLPLTCQHCKNPGCVKVCPTGSSRKTANGSVQIDKATCIGCKLCIKACPYGVRYFNTETQIVEKCTMCQQLIEQKKEPMCVWHCTGRARFFGDLDDPNSVVSKKLKAAGNRAYALPDEGNHPSYRYILKMASWKNGKTDFQAGIVKV
jgi:Fe-S-cluster-containing dehydrogenase component